MATIKVSKTKDKRTVKVRSLGRQVRVRPFKDLRSLVVKKLKDMRTVKVSKTKDTRTVRVGPKPKPPTGLPHFEAYLKHLRKTGKPMSFGGR